MMSEQEKVYVTYQWLLVTAISILSISLLFLYFAFSSITKALDSKADIKWTELKSESNAVRIQQLCIQLDKMESKQDKMLDLLHKAINVPKILSESGRRKSE